MNRLLFAAVAVMAILWSACTPSNDRAALPVEPDGSDIQLGTSKDDILDAYGVPERRMIQKGSLGTHVGFDPDPMRSCRRAQPDDEGWYWKYEKFVVVLSDGKVLHVQQLSEDT